MDISQLQQELLAGKVSQVYLLYGSEDALKHKAEKAIIEAVLTPESRDFNYHIFDADIAVDQLQANVETVPFFGEKQVISVRNTNLFHTKRKSKAGGEETGEDQGSAGIDSQQLLDMLHNLPDFSYLIFSAATKPSQKKLLNELQKNGRLIECEMYKARDAGMLVAGLVQKYGKTIRPDATDIVIGTLSSGGKISSAVLENELEKITLYVGDRTVIEKKDVMSVITKTPESSVFALLDAVAQKKPSQALTLLRELADNGNHPIMLLSLLVRQMRQIWQAKLLLDKRATVQDIGSTLSLAPWQAEKITRQAKLFNREQLEAGFVHMAALDADMKSSRIDGTTGMAMLIAELSK